MEKFYECLKKKKKENVTVNKIRIKITSKCKSMSYSSKKDLIKAL